jgi:hypothetical protein
LFAPGRRKPAAAQTAAGQSEPVFFRPVCKSDILRRNSPPQGAATFCIIAYLHTYTACLNMIPHRFGKSNNYFIKISAESRIFKVCAICPQTGPQKKQNAWKLRARNL